MLKKLLKYDFCEIYKFLSVFYVLVIFSALLTRLFFALEQTTIVTIIAQFCVGLFFAMVVNTLVNTLMRNWIRFKMTMYGDESYLTHTLPVTKKEIYSSKFITGMTSLLTSIIVIIIGFIIAYYSAERVTLIKDLINQFFGDINICLFIISFIVIIILELFDGMQSGFIGLIIGNKKMGKRNIISIIYGIIVYFISQILLLLTTLFVGLFNKDILELFLTSTMNTSLLKIMLLISITVYVVVAIIQQIIATLLLNKGVNVD